MTRSSSSSLSTSTGSLSSRVGQVIRTIAWSAGAVVAHRARGAVGGEAALAVGVVSLEVGLARGQGAERAGDQVDRLRLVEVADQRQLHRAVVEPVGDVLAQLGEAQREVVLLRAAA